MTTTPVSVPAPATFASEIKAFEKKVGVWLDPAHIVLIILLATAIFTGVYLYDSRRVDAANAKYAQATAVAVQAKTDAANSAKQNVAFQAQTAAQVAQLQAANATLARANATLAAAMKAESAALAAQQHADTQMTPTDQSKRWQLLVPQAAVIPTPTGFTVDAAGGLATIVALENIPVQAATIVKLDQTVANDDVQIENLGVALTKEQAAHVADVKNDGLQLTASQDQTKQVQAQLVAVKKKARRNVLRAFFVGFVTGGIVTHVLGF